jgi:hypothetical protein
MRVYLNGHLEGDTNLGWQPEVVSRSDCYIGKSNTGTGGSDGYLGALVSYIKFYSGAMAQAQVTAAMHASPYAYVQFDWDFANATSDTITDSVGSIVATLTNGAVSARNAKGIALDGIDDHIVLDLSAVQLGGAMTVEVVVMLTGAFHSQARLFTCANVGAVSDIIALHSVGTSGQLRWYIHSPTSAGASAEVDSSSASDITLGIRYHVVATVSGTTQRLYINGEQNSEITAAEEPGTKTRSNCYVGKSNWPGDGYLSGEVTTLKLYSGAMTQEDVAAAYASHFSFLEFYWDFRSAASDTIIDSVGGVVATLTNGDTNDRTATGITLDGVDDHLELDFGAEAFGGAITVESVVQWNSFTTYSRLISCGNMGTTSGDVFFVRNSHNDARLQWGIRRGTLINDQLIVTTSTVLIPGMRHHIVTTAAGTTMRVYVDGVLVGERTDGWEPWAVTRSNCIIGRSNSANDGLLHGEVAYLKLYSGAMTQAEITAAYETSSSADYMYNDRQMCPNGECCTARKLWIGSSLTAIPDGAFNVLDPITRHCSTSLTAVDFTLATQLVSIGEEAFEGNSGLTAIDLTSATQLDTIGKGAFRVRRQHGTSPRHSGLCRAGALSTRAHVYPTHSTACHSHNARTCPNSSPYSTALNSAHLPLDRIAPTSSRYCCRAASLQSIRRRSTKRRSSLLAWCSTASIAMRTGRRSLAHAPERPPR